MSKPTVNVDDCNSCFASLIGLLSAYGRLTPATYRILPVLIESLELIRCNGAITLGPSTNRIGVDDNA
jgi:hypothetical protein